MYESIYIWLLELYILIHTLFHKTYCILGQNSETFNIEEVQHHMSPPQQNSRVNLQGPLLAVPFRERVI